MCVQLSWNGGASWTNVKTTPVLTSSEVTYVLGSRADTWGRTWSSGDLQPGNFLVRVTNVADKDDRDFRLDWMAVNVSFTPSAPLPQRTGFLSCTSAAPVTTNSGDNNGFEDRPGINACGNGGDRAEDHNSGTTDNLPFCSDAGKDRHIFGGYGLSVPGGATIHGVQVRLDAWSNASGENPFMCVELSWDGGSNWSAPKTTAMLTNSEQTHFLGSWKDTWGHTWTPSQLQNGSFLVRVTNVANKKDKDFRLDWIPVEVSYTP
jgi:hypothetical protein